MNEIQEILNKVLLAESTTMISVNRNMTKIAKAQGKKHGYVQIAVDDESAEGFMKRELVGFVIMLSGEEYQSIVNELENSNSTESAQPKAEAVEGDSHE